MKKGKIILGAAAVIVTAASSLAFKIASKFNSTHLYYQSTDACVTVKDVFAVRAGEARQISDGSFTLSNGAPISGINTLYTQKPNALQCLQTVTKYQIEQ